VAPGGGYGADGPLLMFSAVAAQRHGATMRSLAWDFRAAVTRGLWCPSAVAAVLDEGDDGAAVDSPEQGRFPAGSGPDQRRSKC
jgi:hypothetical protein